MRIAMFSFRNRRALSLSSSFCLAALAFGAVSCAEDDPGAPGAPPAPAIAAAATPAATPSVTPPTAADAMGGKTIAEPGFNLDEIVHRVHFAFRAENPGAFDGGDDVYSVKVAPGGSFKFRPFHFPPAKNVSARIPKR